MEWRCFLFCFVVFFVRLFFFGGLLFVFCCFCFVLFVFLLLLLLLLFFLFLFCFFHYVNWIFKVVVVFCCSCFRIGRFSLFSNLFWLCGWSGVFHVRVTGKKCITLGSVISRNWRYSVTLRVTEGVVQRNNSRYMWTGLHCLQLVYWNKNGEIGPVWHSGYK